jgi:hypothetical protein
MKRIVFLSALLISVILLISILKILIIDIEQLTNYGLGYLVGKIILFISFGCLAFFTKNGVFKKSGT